MDETGHGSREIILVGTRYGNRCPTVASNERMKDANAAITLLEK